MKPRITAAVLLVSTLGCAHMMPVVTLEAAIRDAARAAQRAVGPASDTVKVEISVVTATKTGATLPTPVVPIGVERGRTLTTKLTIDVDLKKFKPEFPIRVEPTVFLLNLRTGELSEPAKSPIAPEK